MVIIMLNEIFLGLLMTITEYLMILLILMILIVVNSLHRDYMEMNGVEMVILPCTVMWCMLFQDVLMWTNAV